MGTICFWMKERNIKRPLVEILKQLLSMFYFYIFLKDYWYVQDFSRLQSLKPGLMRMRRQEINNSSIHIASVCLYNCDGIKLMCISLKPIQKPSLLI